jgi:hypothetical protein
LIIGVVLAMAASSVAAESDAERAERLKKLTAEQKDELLSKKDRFDDMKPEEQARLHALHASIEAAPNGKELQQTLSRYHAWLGTLTSIQRDELRDLPADKRIERIKELLKQQEVQRFQAFVGNLDEDDRQAIFKWLGDFVTEHEEEILEVLPRDERQRIRDMGDPEAKQRTLGFVMGVHRYDANIPAPSREDLNRLMDRLSAKTTAQIEQAPATEQPDRIREMIGAAIFSRRNPPVPDEELRKFYTGLKADQRERLEGLEAEEFKRRLTWMYHAEKNGYRGPGGPGGRGPWLGSGFGQGGPGRPGEGPRGDGPRGDGRRGGGRPDDGKKGPPGERRGKGPPSAGEQPMPKPDGPPPGEAPPVTP